MTEIKTSILGYSKAQVEDLLKNERVEYEKILRSQKERIFTLREENRKIGLELDTLKQRESAIAAALVDARAKAEAIMADTRKKLVEEEAQRKAEMENITAAANKAREILKHVAQEAVEAVYGMRQSFEGVQDKLDVKPSQPTPVNTVNTATATDTATASEPIIIEQPRALEAGQWDRYRLS